MGQGPVSGAVSIRGGPDGRQYYLTITPSGAASVVVAPTTTTINVTTVVSVGTVATLLVAANTDRAGLTIQNFGADELGIAFGPGVAFADCPIRLPQYAFFSLPSGNGLVVTNAVYGIRDAGATTDGVGVLELEAA